MQCKMRSCALSIGQLLGFVQLQILLKMCPTYLIKKNLSPFQHFDGNKIVGLTYPFCPCIDNSHGRMGSIWVSYGSYVSYIKLYGIMDIISLLLAREPSLIHCICIIQAYTYSLRMLGASLIGLALSVALRSLSLQIQYTLCSFKTQLLLFQPTVTSTSVLGTVAIATRSSAAHVTPRIQGMNVRTRV